MEDYDARQEPLASEAITRGKKKSTKRWCKGKVGREHVPEVVESHVYGFLVHIGHGQHAKCHERDEMFKKLNGGWFCRHAERCATCGKILRDQLPREECPEG